MEHYLDIRLLPDPAFVPPVLMNALFAKLHRGLATLQTRAIGISFPDVKKQVSSLGERLRLHGGDSELERLMALSWLTGMHDHVHVEPIRPVPEVVRYRVVYRVQAKSSPQRLRRRWMKRKGLSEEEARQAIPDNVAERLDLPFITLTSQSTGKRFHLFIKHGPLHDRPTPGNFSNYGLSRTSTVPWF